VGPYARLLACSLAVLGLWKAWVPEIHGDRVPLVLYPWLVLAGLPRRSPVEAPWRALVHELALLAPPLALAARLDRSGGTTTAAVMEVATAGVLLVAILSSSASLASAAAFSRAVHGGLWFVAVLVLPLACAVLGWGEPRATHACASLSSASPLGWIHARATSAASPPWPALALSLVLLTVAWFTSARASRR
jgi:hypothetical protein